MKQDRQSTKVKKNAVIQALEKTLGVVTPACQKAGISRDTFYEWFNKDEEFRKAVKATKDIALDFTENELLKQIKEGDTTAIIFYLKTQGKNRGYVERQESVVSVNPFLEAMKHVDGESQQ